MPNKQIKNVLLTFDYEIFLGSNSGSLQQSLIQPTNILLAKLKKYNSKAIFFVDTTYIQTLEKYKTIEAVAIDYNTITAQVLELIQLGHQVYPHIHPHWLDAVYNTKNNTWDLSNFEKYRFATISTEAQQNLFSYGVTLLQTLIAKIGSTQQVNSYRAGGWSIQPFATFEPYFTQFNITNDFSVMAGFASKSNAQQYDFTNVPLKDKYKFDSDITSENENGVFTEYAISAIHLPTTTNWIATKVQSIATRLGFGKWYAQAGDGATVNLKEQKAIKLVIDNKTYQPATIEYMHIFNVKYFVQHLQHNNYLQLISHSKMMSKMNMLAFTIFLKKIHKKFIVNTDFTKI